MDFLEGLNPAQLEAVTSTEGYVRVIAGAGSGKTRALSHRFAYLVEELGILPGNILCVTFTNKSAAEMRERIHRLTGDNDTGYVNTFHGFCVSVLQEDSHAVSYPKSFLVLDNADIDEMLKIIYEERGLTLRDMTFGNARDMIEIRKCLTEPEYYLDMITMPLEVLRDKYLAAVTAQDIIFYGYLYQEKKCFGLDYNDLIKFSLYIFREHADIRQKWQERLMYIMIDEFQDIDGLQYELMEVLSGWHKNLFIVGDPDQTIYTWRGASVKYLLNFDRNFPGTKTIMMMENYRSRPQILAAANALIDKNKERMKKDLLPVRNGGEQVMAHHAETAADEADHVVSKIRELKESGVPLKEITVLYRAHYLTRPLEDALIREKVPYAIYSGVPFFGRMEIRDAVAYLRMIAFRDDLSFRRIANVPKRNLGKRRMQFLEEYAKSREVTLYEALRSNLEDPIFRGTGAAAFVSMIDRFAAEQEGRQISEVLADILNASGYEKMLRTEGSQERLDNLAEFKQSVYEYETGCGEETTLEHYLKHIALFSGLDAETKGPDRVRLMTVHTAKGLEFPYVFIIGMNEGIFPSRKTRTKEGMEEERRLAFVALTRAKERLYLSEAGGRNFDNSERYPSRFLFDIGDDILHWDKKPAEGLLAEAKQYIAFTMIRMGDVPEESFFEAGTRVRHPAFGEGTVKSLDADRRAYVIRFDNLPTDRVIACRAKMERIE